jgi:hypothetical protein
MAPKKAVKPKAAVAAAPGGGEVAAPAAAASAAAGANAGAAAGANEDIYLALQSDIATIMGHPVFKKIETAGALEIDAPASASPIPPHRAG